MWRVCVGVARGLPFLVVTCCLWESMRIRCLTLFYAWCRSSLVGPLFSVDKALKTGL